MTAAKAIRLGWDRLDIEAVAERKGKPGVTVDLRAAAEAVHAERKAAGISGAEGE